MGVRASPTHALTYENVRIPKDHLLGEPGQGLYQTLQVLDGGRVGIGAAMRRSERPSVRHSQSIKPSNG